MRMTKLRKYGIIFLVLLMALMCAPMAMATTEISDFNGLKDAFSAGGKDYKLAADITVTEELKTSKDVVLDLNGHVISTDKMIHVGDTVDTTKRGTAGSLVLNNTSATVGEIRIIGTEKHGNCIQVNGDWTQPAESRTNIPSTLTINKGVKITSTGWYCVSVFGKGATLNVNDAELQAGLDLASVAIRGRGNPWDNGTTINITGGVFTAGNVYEDSKPENGSGLVIYHPQSGDLRISGGTFTAYDGIQMKAGNLTMTGGTVTAQGAMPTPVANHDGSVGIGAALSLVTCSAYTGDINVNISDGVKLESTGLGSYAIFEKIIEKSPVSKATKLKSFNISEGTFTGKAGALSLENFADIKAAITGGTYSSDPKDYVRAPYVVKKTGNEYTVVLAGVVVTPDTAELVLDFAPVRTLTASSDITEDFEWVSENGSVVTVDGNGNITAVGAGTANVTATGAISGSVGKCVVTVRKAAPVSVTPANMELKIGETGKVEAKYDAKDSVSWSSSNQAVATVKDGTVTAGKKAGVAIITAKGTYTSAACTLTVIDPVTPDPTPTPAPVDPGTVGKDKNPVNNEKDKPENVEAATPAIKEATEDAKDDISNTTNIKKENLVATANGTLTISPVLAKSALEEVMSADKEVAPKNVVLLPIVSTTVKAKNVAAMAFSMTGAQLGAEEGTVAGDVKIIKVLADGKGAQFSYASSAAGYQDETFTLKDANDKTLALTDKVVKTSDYKLIIFVADGGNFDLDKTPGSVVDPVAVATNAAKPTPHSSSSGCNAGFAGLLLLAAVPFIYRRKR